MNKQQSGGKQTSQATGLEWEIAKCIDNLLNEWDKPTKTGNHPLICRQQIIELVNTEVERLVREAKLNGKRSENMHFIEDYTRELKAHENAEDRKNIKRRRQSHQYRIEMLSTPTKDTGVQDGEER